MLIEFEFDPESGEYTPISREIIDNSESKKTKTETKTKPKSKSKSSVESTEPQIILESNKYILNEAAVEALGVSPDDRIDIKYEKKGKLIYPVIGSNDVFGTKAGNKLTNSLTVSYRGKSNETLAEYGTIFTFTPHESKEGLFVLVGDKEVSAKPVVETSSSIDTSILDDEPTEDIPLDLNLESIVDSPDNKITKLNFTL